MNSLRPGDHIYVSYGFFTHHGIYVGDGSVVELFKNWKKIEEPSDVPHIRRISIEVFADGREVRVRQYAPSECDPPDVVVGRALSRIGEKGYDLFNNNCEHFATWCKTGQARSSQVESLARLQTSVENKLAAKPVVEALVSRVVTVAPRLASKTPLRLGMPVLFAPDVAQFVVEHFSATMGGADPKTARNLGRGVGFFASLGMGWGAGGPIGAAALTLSWFASELQSWLADN
jgi:hypothetical protein